MLYVIRVSPNMVTCWFLHRFMREFSHGLVSNKPNTFKLLVLCNAFEFLVIHFPLLLAMQNTH